MSEQWFALLHTPGPALPAGQSVFDHPGFAEHFAFLQRLAADGLLVAAGPLTDSDGDGLTVIRAESAEQAQQLAEQQGWQRPGRGTAGAGPAMAGRARPDRRTLSLVPPCRIG
jgi:hypothetical protein